MVDWNKVGAYIKKADSVAWDGCHKIYILMDKEETQKMIEYGYSNPPSVLVPADAGALKVVAEWYRESCPLRFISAVKTVNEGDEGDGFTTVVPQI